ncbi:hypothetical protein RHSIM_Rhsim04G0186700 [Rhododendron simsii]|uniref:Non-haem dioxygenase N-terminal domain-containing protein n=1 Tax=Rhododendron simsii TaxID=118357 RepID=A0A834H490_RHOSS|nr:hypothetical protein RHSIM_Rhsim04G0186700 [Rhododendron simsii]
MVVTSNGEEIQEQTKPEYDRKSELKAFDDTKTGVKGLVDAGVTKIPRIFIHDKSKLNDISTTSCGASLFSVPIIDFEGVDQGSAQRAGIIQKVRDACEKLGFFQVVNHGIAKYLMDDMIDGVRRFHEQDTEVKKGFYSRDVTRKFIYNSNFDLYTGPATNWRDTISCFMAPQPPDPQELPAVCRYDDAHDQRPGGALTSDEDEICLPAKTSSTTPWPPLTSLASSATTPSPPPTPTSPTAPASSSTIPPTPWASLTPSSSPSRSQSPSVNPSSSPESWAKMGFLTSNPSIPSLRCRTTIAEAVLKSSCSDDLDSPKLERKTNTTKLQIPSRKAQNLFWVPTHLGDFGDF